VATIRNVHAWKERTEEGKREVRVEKFGRTWKVQARIDDGEWHYYASPPLEDLHTLRDILFRKYQRKRVSHDDLADIDKMIKERSAQLPSVRLPKRVELDSGDPEEFGNPL
jgi:hypothetical protein